LTQYLTTKKSLLPGKSNIDNLEGISELGYTIPIMKVEYKRSPNTRDDDTLKEGLFTSSLGGQKEKIRCVILRGRPSRVYWPEKFDPTEENPTPICKSNDGIRPSQDIEEPKNDKCADCPYAQWGKDSEKPKCALVYNLLCLDMETGIPFIISAKRTSLKPLRAYLTKFYFSQKATYSIETIIGIRKMANYYLLQFSEGEELRKQDVEIASKYAQDLADAFRRTEVTETTEAEEENGEEAPEVKKTLFNE